MNPAFLLLLAEKNASDIEAIVAKIGVGNLISLMPNIVNILKTLQQQPASKP
jgi:hypothetical protein